VLGEGNLAFEYQRSSSGPGSLKPSACCDWEMFRGRDMEAVAEVLGESKVIESSGELPDGPDISIAGEG